MTAPFFAVDTLVIDPYLLILPILLAYVALLILKLTYLRFSRFCPFLISLATLEAKVIRSLLRYLSIRDIQRYLKAICSCRWVRDSLSAGMHLGVLAPSIMLCVFLFTGMYLGIDLTYLLLLSTTLVLLLITSTITPYIQSLIHMAPSDREVTEHLLSLGYNPGELKELISGLSRKISEKGDRGKFDLILVENVKEIACLIPYAPSQSITYSDPQTESVIESMTDYIESSLRLLLGNNIKLREGITRKLKYARGYLLHKRTVTLYIVLIISSLIASVTTSRLLASLLISKGYYVDVLLTPTATTYVLIAAIPAVIAVPTLLLMTLLTIRDGLPHTCSTRFFSLLKSTDAFATLTAIVAPVLMVRGVDVDRLYLITALAVSFAIIVLSDYSLLINTWETSIIFYVFVIPCVQYLITGFPKLSIITAVTFLSTRPLIRYLATPYLSPTDPPSRLLHNLAIGVVTAINACLAVVFVVLGLNSEVLTAVIASAFGVTSYLSILKSLRRLERYSVGTVCTHITKCSALSLAVLITYLYTLFINPIPNLIKYLHEPLLGPLVEVAMFFTMNACFIASAMLRR